MTSDDQDLSMTGDKRKNGDIEANVDLENALKELCDCQNEICDSISTAAHEILGIEAKYNHLRKPFREQRNRLIDKIPDFWLRTFSRVPDIRAILCPEQAKCLTYLRKLEVEDQEDVHSGFWIRLYFAENPYFENDVLIKEFRLVNDPCSISTEIKWKKDMDLTELLRHKMAKPIKNRHIKLPDNFFAWFNDNTDPWEDHIAYVIKEDVWANPLQFCAEHYYEDEKKKSKGAK